MGTVIVVTSGKGGTGKTSVTAGVASSLALMGKSVLCIDMDIGLRNLDISLGMSDRALMDFSDVILERCSLTRGAVAHPELPSLFLLTAPMRLNPLITTEKVTELLDLARALYDYIFIDCPAGVGTGFHLATCAADRAIVVATNDASALRDAQHAVNLLSHMRVVHLVMNRIQPKLLAKLGTTIDDAMDSAGLPLVGVIPEDPIVMLGANLGRPLAVSRQRKGAVIACRNIAMRLDGRHVPIMKIR